MQIAMVEINPDKAASVAKCGVEYYQQVNTQHNRVVYQFDASEETVLQKQYKDG